MPGHSNEFFRQSQDHSTPSGHAMMQVTSERIATSLEEGSASINWNTLKEVSSGGQGKVYTVNIFLKKPSSSPFCPQFECRQVALKKLMDQTVPAFREHFIITNSDHSSSEHNIIKLIGVIEYQGDKYAILPYCDTFLDREITSLNTIKNSDPLLFATIVTKLMRDLLNALEYMHNEKKFVYRDMKPANIAWHKDYGCFCLADLDVSTEIGPDSDCYVGSPLFSPAGVFARDISITDPVIDIHGLGGVLLYLIDEQEQKRHQTELRKVSEASWMPYFQSQKEAYASAKLAAQTAPLNPDSLTMNEIVSKEHVMNHLKLISTFMTCPDAKQIPKIEKLIELFSDLFNQIIFLDERISITDPLAHRFETYVKTMLVGNASTTMALAHDTLHTELSTLEATVAQKLRPT